MGHKLVFMVIGIHLKDLVRAVSIRLLSSFLCSELEEVKGKIIEGLSFWLIHVGHIKCVFVIWWVFRQDA